MSLAFQGSSGTGDASVAQYAPAVPNSEPDPGGNGGNGGETQTLSGNSGDGNAGQLNRQVSAAGVGGGKLPFTGIAAIPLILLGLAMLVAGVVLRRRNSADLS